MSASERHPETPTPDRKPGRSFTDPRRPLGEDLIERAGDLARDPEGGVYGRAEDRTKSGVGVAERAKAVAVLRKAEELMASGNPSGETEDGRRRALELATGRVGLTIEEYDEIVDNDEEIRDLQAVVLDEATRRATSM